VICGEHEDVAKPIQAGKRLDRLVYCVKSSLTRKDVSSIEEYRCLAECGDRAAIEERT